MAETRQTDAVVLNCVEHGESDVILTLFCQDVGRLSAIAKGAKKSQKRFVNKLELFSFLHISYQQKATKSLAFLIEAELHTSFLQLRHDLHLYSIASVIREFLLQGIREQEPDPAIFRLCLWALHNLDRQQPPLTVLCMFLIRFYDHLGYRPDLAGCGHCTSPVSSHHRYSFDTTSGRLICFTCSPPRAQGIALSHGTIKILRSIQDQPLERLHRLKMSGSILYEAVSLLQSYGNQLLQRDIVSWKMARKFLKK